MSGLDDLDGDGSPDIAIGSLYTSSGLPYGCVRVVSGRTGALLFTFDGEVSGDEFGASLARLGDVNADGSEDFVVGSPGDSTNGPAAGRASVHSGLNGSLLFESLGDATFDAFGEIVRAAGDVDADGTMDLVVGTDVGLPTGSGYARVISGANGATLHTLHGTHPWDYFGSSLTGAGDADGDGLRCAGGAVVRIGVRMPNPAGDASWGPGLGAAGDWVPGDSRYFQVWYRDALPQGACGQGFNLSNGLAALIVP